jgi:glucose-6-phosphate isomerase
MLSTTLLDQLVADRIASRIFGREVSVFAPAGSPLDRVGNVKRRLDWLAAPETFAPRVPELANFAHDCRDDQIHDVYLLGMGGSSLCAEVLRALGPEQSQAPRLTVVDTTDERTIREITDALAPAQTLFVVASKSGATIEATSLEHHFWNAMEETLGDHTGRHFVAITDPDTRLATLARDHHYRESFLNPPDIGGRYSALSLFGLVPAALLRQPLDALLGAAQAMAAACREDAAANPGLALGAFMASAATVGRDKLTILTAPEFESLGMWIEQLVAESTGKDGRGILPIVAEPIGKAGEYGDDRAFVIVTRPQTTELGKLGDELMHAGHPVFRIEMTPEALGGEFFRWEFATAVAGRALGVNPFDEPNVDDGKRRTLTQLDVRRAQGAFRIDPPFDRGQGYSRREHARSTGGEDRDAARGYVAILDYLPLEPKRADVIARLRATLRRRSGLATTYGVGPRYLHSTGQYHKGGPNTGLFLLFTAVDNSVTAVPGTDYTFSALKLAQALGDFEALAAAGRHVVHYHIEDPSADYSAALDLVLRSYR